MNIETQCSIDTHLAFEVSIVREELAHEIALESKAEYVTPKDERLIDGTMQFLEDIRQSGDQFVFITNNSTKSIQDYILKFQKLGIKTDYRNFITASYATIHYLKKNYDDKLIYAMVPKSITQRHSRLLSFKRTLTIFQLFLFI